MHRRETGGIIELILCMQKVPGTVLEEQELSLTIDKTDLEGPVV